MGLFSSLFGRTGWDLMPAQFGSNLRQQLGEQRFGQFTALCHKYRLFDQMSEIAKQPSFAPDGSRIMLAGFFAHVGNELGGKGVREQNMALLKESIEFCRVALEISPDLFSARLCLATAYMGIGDSASARTEAKQTLLDIDRVMGSPAFKNAPADIAMPFEVMQEYKRALSTLAEGRMPI